jgi:hypothetical protein
MAADVVLEVRFPGSIYASLRAGGADEALLSQEAREGLARRLYEEQRLSLAEAAELAALPTARFLELLRPKDPAATGSGAAAEAPAEASSYSIDPAATLSMTTTLRRLGELMVEEEYDADFLKPTLPAYEFAWNLLAGAIAGLTGNVPPASPAAVGDGGIFLQWGEQDRYVRLLVPADPSQAYLYCKGDGETRTIREVNSVRLAHSLDWLARG